MSRIIRSTRVSEGRLRLQDIPLEDDTEVAVIVILKVNLAKMSFSASRQLTKSIPGNLADDVLAERRAE